MQVVGRRADHRHRAVESGGLQTVAEAGVAMDVGNSPPLHHARQPGVRVVVDHHHGDRRQMQLLDRAEADPGQAADDDVPDELAWIDARHPVMVAPTERRRVADT